MNVARLNFSHGTHDDHARAIARIRRLKGVAILQDLSGPRVRIGPMREGRATLKVGSTVTLVPREIAGDAETIGVNTPSLLRALRRGDTVLLAEGQLQLDVVRAGRTGARCRVVVGGVLTGRKGINVPARSLDLPALTDKDRRDLAFGTRRGVDLVALSFVQSGEDVRRCRKLARGRPIIAKIEKHSALANLDGILAEADGIMVARGDLGVEIPLERVPIEQKRIIRAANAVGRPVITATQMLRSMVDSPRPTRAETTDVANAVLDGTDAVMLSEETAVGRYPIEAVRFMARVLEQADPHVPQRFGRNPKGDSEAIAESACELAAEVGAAAILVPTQSGSSALRVAARRPRCRVLAFSPNEAVLRRLAVVWGVEALPSPQFAADPLEEVRHRARKYVRGRVVITAGWPFHERGRTNLALVTTV